MFNGERTTKRIRLGATAFVAVIAIGSLAYGATNDPIDPSTTPATVAPAIQTVDAVAVAFRAEELSDSEAAGILFMREEEKLARDVYLTLYDAWGLRIFTNIAASEQTHMDAVLGLVENYGLDDPVGENPVGVFEDDELQEMYNDLVASGSESVEAALAVGALIEEIDIEDLAVYLEKTTTLDTAKVYERLLSGSENHLRAFVAQLASAGIEYQPTVLDSDTFGSILSSEIERGDRGAARRSGRVGRRA